MLLSWQTTLAVHPVSCRATGERRRKALGGNRIEPSPLT